VLEETMDDFLRFMHSNADDIFDFSKEIVFLDKELQQLFPTNNEDELTIKIVDKLAKVYTREGREEWIWIHCEVQEKYSNDFPDACSLTITASWTNTTNPFLPTPF
jgi:hypothetical protein